MITKEQIIAAEKTGQYQFPFLDGDLANSVRNSELTFEQYISNEENWFSEKGYKYTLKEMQSAWSCVLVQRLKLEAALMVVNGKFKGINQGKRLLGIF
jgi:hypothetical protein